MTTWHAIDGRLIHDDLPAPLASVMSEPYPLFWWYVNSGKLTHEGLPEKLTQILYPPYPSFLWYVENSRLTHKGLPARIGRLNVYLGDKRIGGMRINEQDVDRLIRG